jgi:hypothetical protein
MDAQFENAEMRKVGVGPERVSDCGTYFVVSCGAAVVSVGAAVVAAAPSVVSPSPNAANAFSFTFWK